MKKRQLVLLFISSLIPWTIGNGILPLLPVYAGKLGASSSEAGAYLAISYIGITLGALSAGWISGRFQSCKKPLAAVSLAAVPLVWLTGQVGDLTLLTIATAALWFLGGMGFALISILAGLAAQPTERGKVFGVLSLAGPVGMLLGGAASGPIVDQWGFAAMFSAFAAFSLLWPAAALNLKDAQVKHAGEQALTAQPPAPLGWMFWWLFLSGLAAAIANTVCILGRSLVMDALRFNAAAISSTGAVGGAVALPLGLLAGLLSDKFGRRGLLALGYFSITLGLGLLSAATALWHFGAAIALVSAQNAVSGAVGSALVADLVSKRSFGIAMAVFSATTWVGGVVGFAATGLVIEHLGFTPTFLLAGLLPLASIGLLAAIRVSRPAAPLNPPIGSQPAV